VVAVNPTTLKTEREVVCTYTGHCDFAHIRSEPKRK